MEATTHQRDARRAGHETSATTTMRVELDASARALLAAHDAHVRDAMNSVEWERRGLLQRLTRGPR
jgi:hypothetical protein